MFSCFKSKKKLLQEKGEEFALDEYQLLELVDIMKFYGLTWNEVVPEIYLNSYCFNLILVYVCYMFVSCFMFVLNSGGSDTCIIQHVGP